jgi:hypothetical protein
MVTQSQLVQYFKDLELALDEQRKKGTPGGDPTYAHMSKDLITDFALVGIGQDKIAAFAQQCGHAGTLERLEKLNRKAIGFPRQS